MDQLRQQESINMTEALKALSPWLNNPRRTVIQAEAFTAGIIMLLLLQLILGSYRRQSTRFLVQAGTWVTFTVSFPLIAYTLGLMQSSPVKNVNYPIWAALLLLAAGCTNAVKVYELDDNKQWKTSLFDLAQYFIYSAVISCLLFPYGSTIKEYFHDYLKNINPVIKSPAITVLFLAVVAPFTSKAFACWWVDFNYGIIAEFMKDQAAVSNDDGFDPVSMKGYKYPVRLQVQKEKGRLPFRAKPREVRGGVDIITIEEIWQCKGRLFSLDHRTGLRDKCLAKALYELLKRRYYGMACAEERHPETHDFVFKGLLRTGDYERAFRIVEAELGFCLLLLPPCNPVSVLSNPPFQQS